jgi:hypothetical protein
MQITKIQRKLPLKIEVLREGSNMTKIYKIAKDIDIPDGETLSLYTQTLKMYLKDNPKMDEEMANLISKLPAPRKIRQDLSLMELKVLYETLEYLWSNITNSKIIPEKAIISAPETLKGNYWVLNNGILLKGINHYTIIKDNALLISSLLDIGGMTLQEYLHSPPNKLIELILKKGGVRIFITQDKRMYVQCSPEIYGEWCKDKIKKMDFKYKVIKVIDFKSEYKGWNSGLSILL